MSEHYLKLIPTEPTFVPNNESQLVAVEFMKSLFTGDCEIKIGVSSEIKFIDAGINFEKISCPNCKSELSSKWWSTEMEKAHQTNFNHLETETPCCKSRTTLNDLNYHFPQGFAKFIIAVRNPNISAIDKPSYAKLEQTLGCKLRTIWAHY
jgi:hypothetical protein